MAAFFHFGGGSSLRQPSEISDSMTSRTPAPASPRVTCLLAALSTGALAAATVRVLPDLDRVTADGDHALWVQREFVECRPQSGRLVD